MNIKVKNKIKGKIVKEYYDYKLLAVVIILMCFGLVMLYSASAYDATINHKGNDIFFLKRQAIIGVVSLILAIVISKINYHWLLKLALPVYIISVLLMLAVKITPLGRSYNGARRWLAIGPIEFQPAEIAKIAVILFLTVLIFNMGREFYTLKGTAKALLAAAIPFLCAFFLTDNLSTGIIIFAIGFFIIFTAHPNTKAFLIAIIAIAAVVIVALILMRNLMSTGSNFRMDRILVWMDPEKYADLGGYQVLQGLYAIGSGGLFGKGLGNSMQKISTIPEAQNDMIFSIICEELGLVGAIVLILLFAYLLYRILVIARSAPDLQGCLIATGVFIHISLQVILNICVVLNAIPTTGVTLPFVSYGGTSTLFLMTEIGLVLGVANRIQLKVKPMLTNRNIDIKLKS